MRGADLTLLADAARAAGKLATAYFRRDPRVWDKPDAQGPVTEADLAVDRLLRERLCAARPDHGWYSEESPEDPARLSHRRLFIVDPIDGTRAFIEGNPTWSHSLAISEDGEITAAAVYLPVHDRLYLAERGGGATLNNLPITVTGRETLDDAEVLAAKPAMEPQRWRNAEPPRIKRQFRSSLAYRMALAAEGRKDAMMTLRPTWEWDVAAGTLLVQEAGGTVTDRLGAPLVFNRPDRQFNGVIAGTDAVQNALVSRLFR